MTIHRENSFSLNGVKSDYCMKVSGANTVAALTVIRTRPTSKRAGPPACGNGFDTSYLAFARGHVIALELGGSDDVHNVVPQFEHWQGKPNGEWRQMEMALGQHGGKAMLVEIGYGRTGGTQTHATMKTAFEANRLIDWTDERIPDRFDVWVWPKGSLDLSAIANDADFDQAVTTLKTKGAVYATTFALGNAMPEPDRGMYITQEAITIAMDRWEDYEDDDGKPPMTPISFLMLEDTLPAIRDDLSGIASVTPTEAAGFQLQPLILGWHKTTMPKARKKHEKRLKEGYKMLSYDIVEPTYKPPKKKQKV